MANPHRGQVALGNYTLSFSVNALCELEDLLDKPMMEIVTAIQTPEKMRMNMVRALFWASLRDHHEEIDLKEAGQIVSDLGMKAAMAKVGEAFRLAFPEAGAGAEANGKQNPRRAKAES
ncbi:hypothetical protein [Shinella sp. BYT-45]|uniref:hypothetical protein n=1 Tax=Shinella sp. BYT-45 TaxID=3377377 RepID=UPI003981488C